MKRFQRDGIIKVRETERKTEKDVDNIYAMRLSVDLVQCVDSNPQAATNGWKYHDLEHKKILDVELVIPNTDVIHRFSQQNP